MTPCSALTFVVSTFFATSTSVTAFCSFLQQVGVRLTIYLILHCVFTKSMLFSIVHFFFIVCQVKWLGYIIDFPLFKRNMYKSRSQTFLKGFWKTTCLCLLFLYVRIFLTSVFLSLQILNCVFYVGYLQCRTHK